jgi:hypothetical protein
MENQHDLQQDAEDDSSHGRREEVRVGGELGLPFPLLAIESLDQFVQRHGILHAEARYGDQSQRNLHERQRAMQQELEYQQEIHTTIFGNDNETEERTQVLESIIDSKDEMNIETCKETIEHVPLRKMAESCDTIMALTCFHQSQPQTQRNGLTFSLSSFDHNAVIEFLALVLGNKTAQQVSSEHIVECCEIARYLQCDSVLESLVDILEQSMNASNCMSLCLLADRLDLPRLFETSMRQMMTSIENLQQDDLFQEFSPELQRKIFDMQTVLHSSIHANHHKLYFGTMQEYLSIFAENVQYYRERLAEAKERQAEGAPLGGRAWDYAQAKIANQEARLQTLERVLKEQQQLFGTRL